MLRRGCRSLLALGLLLALVGASGRRLLQPGLDEDNSACRPKQVGAASWGRRLGK